MTYCLTPSYVYEWTTEKYKIINFVKNIRMKTELVFEWNLIVRSQVQLKFDVITMKNYTFSRIFQYPFNRRLPEAVWDRSAKCSKAFCWDESAVLAELSSAFGKNISPRCQFSTVRHVIENIPSKLLKNLLSCDFGLEVSDVICIERFGQIWETCASIPTKIFKAS